MTFSHKRNKYSIIFLIFLLFITCIHSIAFGDPLTKRLGGQTRYETAVTISKEGWKTTSNYAVLATGADFPDALSAAPLAKKLNAPILLTTKDSLIPAVADEFTRLKVNTVYIIGGTGVISTKVENDLKNLNISYIRLAGPTRYETAVRIAQEIGVNQGQVFITNGYNFTEALSVSPIAAKMQIPILLVNKDEFPEALKSFLKDKKVTTSYILGGTDLISQNTEKNFANPIRIQGANPYERNINIIKYFEKNIDFTNVYIATGKDYPDALAGSALAPLTSSCILLVDDKNISTVTKDYVKSIGSKISTFSVLGLEGAVNDPAIESLKSQTQSSTPQPLKIVEVN